MTIESLFVLLAIIGIFVFLLLRSHKKSSLLEGTLSKLRKTYDVDSKRWSGRPVALEAQLKALAKYQGIVDADAAAAEILQSAQTVLNNAQQKADSLLESTRQEANGITTTAREQAKATKEEAKVLLDSATRQASKVISDANKRAEDIAGSAYTAMKNAALYEQAAKAMRNVIEGYGDQYVIPTQSLLDDLAEEYGFTQAGEELKNTRERAKSMVRNRTAAMCDYVEANRKETAIDFVLDAFNGKVDSILSRVKRDNAGTLEQEIRDAFTLVNFNGKAFRNARITEEYCTIRLEELRWAAVIQELKLQEREEQRRIKEQLREEEKARRDYERAMREAAKEEDLLRKAMEKVQKQVEQAKAEQKATYEEQLFQLTEKLKAAEEKNQRALSMAQQTKKGHVYIISNIGSFGEEVFKIGLTRRLEPHDRIRELGDASVPFGYDVHAMIMNDDAPALERELHKRFLLRQVNKVNYRKEFFRLSLQEIHEEIEKMGLSAKWTMLAEAREYRETLAIEHAIKDNPEMQRTWVQRQLELDPTEGMSTEADEGEGTERNGTYPMRAAIFPVVPEGAIIRHSA